MKESLRVVACAALVALAAPAAAGAQSNLPPGATTTDATTIGATTATLNGVVDSHRENTNHYFEYGTTTTYGSQTATQTEPGSNSARAVSAMVIGLAVCTTYHFRLVASNQFGTDQGQDKTFTTTGCPPPRPNAVTIAPLPRIVGFGRPTFIAGQVTGPNSGGVQVVLQEAPYPFTGPFDDVTSMAADAAGRYSFVATPSLHTRYLVVARTSPPVASATVQVNVRYAVSLSVSDTSARRGQFVRFSGSVRPAHNNRIVQIQRRSRSGRYRTVDRVRMLSTSNPARSTYSKRLRIFGTGTYRVRVPADTDHLTATSRPRRIRVR